MDDQLKAFDALLDKTVRAPRLSGSKVTELKGMAIKLVANDHHIVTSLLRLNTSLPPASTMRISNLYVFDAIARAAKSDVLKGVGRTVSTQRGKGTQAGLLDKMEGVVDSIVEGMVDDGRGGVWSEGKDKTRKIIEIWRKSNTFPDECIKQLTARISSASTPAGMSPALRSPGKSIPARSTTPTDPPPLHVIERYGVAAAAAPISAPDTSSATNSPVPAQAPAPAHLPPEIMALLGVKSPGGTPPAKPSSSSSAALDAVLANVRNPAAPQASAPQLPNLDPTQLAALANIAALTGGPGAAGPSRPPPMPNFPPPNGVGNHHNGTRYDRERARSRSPDWRRNDDRDPRFRDRGDSRDYGRDPRDRQDSQRDPYPPPRRDYPAPPPNFRPDLVDERPQQRDPRRDPRVPRDFDGHRDHLPPKPDHGLPPRPAPPPPTSVQSPPHPSRDAGWGSAPPIQSAYSAPPPVPAPSGGGLESFDLTTFNPTSADSWAALGAAWKVSTGRDPNQMELMGFLATGQVPDSMGMGNSMMGQY